MMIKLRLQMFGGGGLPAHKGGGGGRQMDKLTETKEEKEKTKSTQETVEKQKVSTPQRTQAATRPDVDYKTPVTGVSMREEYTIHRLRAGKESVEQERITGEDIIRQGYHFDQREGVWRDKTGRQFRIRRTRRK